jgi:polyribonucleotide nucleotidyltransferase
VAGTKNGICGIQLDIKIAGISREIIADTFEAAKKARLYILAEMEKVISQPKPKISDYAPKIVTITIPIDKIKDVIGHGGKVIKNIVATTGAKINVGDDGTATIAGPNNESTLQALNMIEYLIADAEVGKTYPGKVVKIMSFGAFVEILPGKEGLVHISQLADYHVKNVEDVVREGDEILVKVIGIDEQGRISLSKKAAHRI